MSVRSPSSKVPICKVAFPDALNFDNLASEISEVISGNPCYEKARKNYANCMYQRGKEYCKQRYKTDIENCPTNNHPSIKCAREFILYELKRNINTKDPGDLAKAFIDLHGMNDTLRENIVNAPTPVPPEEPLNDHQFKTPVPIDDSPSTIYDKWFNNSPKKLFNIIFCILVGVLVIVLIYYFVFDKSTTNGEIFKKKKVSFTFDKE